ncbi:Piso0_004867 [Millerozyma farinosa CBS 7064]|uniref:Piso0_004867 protein n=1 Tax=Pichia sorbitophila (strain ATCC MYA-4447 / BCRC 22081 / CBS 7064 / NBRC 10061 / NRRL Y-12695) TaxID=559304 RepID=G8Y3L5_PICSO|nr:Piso0_004867 [Millerozyma farinosa CBS 7064]
MRRRPTDADSVKMEYNKGIQNYYYVNTRDNTISFDSPDEVSHKVACGTKGALGAGVKPLAKISKSHRAKETSAEKPRSNVSPVIVPDAASKRGVLSRLGWIMKRKNSSKTASEASSTSSGAASSDMLVDYHRSSSRESVSSYAEKTPSLHETLMGATNADVEFDRERERMELLAQIVRELET